MKPLVLGSSHLRDSTACPFVLLQIGNIKVGDYLFAVGGVDTRWAKHDEVVNLVRKSGNHLKLRLITPMNPEITEGQRPPSAPSTPGTPMRMVSPSQSVSAVSSKSNKSRLSAPWIFNKKGSKDKEDKDTKSMESDDGEIFLH